jgi:CHAT domain-containing protein
MADPVYEKADSRVGGRGDLAAVSKAALEEYLSRARGDGGLYPRLRFSAREVSAIRDVFGGGDVLADLVASESAVKAASAKGILKLARYVHFATHGILGLDKGRQPALVLSLVGNDKEDGFLQLDEVTHLKLNADLVVLSACQTGRGHLHRGEGVTGLARAFLYSGSRGVVCSLWSVDDRQTAELMVSMYRHLEAGQPAADALRLARLEKIRQGAAPVYWAPFILIGQ